MYFSKLPTPHALKFSYRRLHDYTAELERSRKARDEESVSFASDSRSTDVATCTHPDDMYHAQSNSCHQCGKCLGPPAATYDTGYHKYGERHHSFITPTTLKPRPKKESAKKVVVKQPAAKAAAPSRTRVRDPGPRKRSSVCADPPAPVWIDPASYPPVGTLKKRPKRGPKSLRYILAHLPPLPEPDAAELAAAAQIAAAAAAAVAAERAAAAARRAEAAAEKRRTLAASKARTRRERATRAPVAVSKRKRSESARSVLRRSKALKTGTTGTREEASGSLAAAVASFGVPLSQIIMLITEPTGDQPPDDTWACPLPQISMTLTARNIVRAGGAGVAPFKHDDWDAYTAHLPRRSAEAYGATVWLMCSADGVAQPPGTPEISSRLPFRILATGAYRTAGREPCSCAFEAFCDTARRSAVPPTSRADWMAIAEKWNFLVAAAGAIILRRVAPTLEKLMASRPCKIIVYLLIVCGHILLFHGGSVANAADCLDLDRIDSKLRPSEVRGVRLGSLTSVIGAFLDVSKPCITRLTLDIREIFQAIASDDCRAVIKADCAELLRIFD